MIKSIYDFYGDDPKRSVDYGRIINEHRFNKLAQYLNEGSVIAGGKIDKDDLYIALTLMENIQA